MDELIVKISQKEDYPENTYRMLTMLREELNKQKGKRVYGYRPQHVKSLVDNIVDELAKDPDISELLKHWNTLQGNLIALYKKDGYDPIPLSQMSEFKSVKNMIIQEAMNIPDDEFVPVSTKEMTDDKPSVRNQHNVQFEDPELSEYTSDFVCTKIDGSVFVRECMYRKNVFRERSVKLLNALQEYWFKRGVTDWKVVIDAETE